MPTFYPVCVTLALFIALILFDIIGRRPELVTQHVLTGLVILFLMTLLSFKDAEFVSWGLLLIPFVVLIICFILGNTGTPTVTAPKAAPSADSAPAAAAPVAPVSCGTPAPVIASPEAISTANQIISDNHLCNLHP
jgi:hypothetical protein